LSTYRQLSDLFSVPRRALLNLSVNCFIVLRRVPESLLLDALHIVQEADVNAELPFVFFLEYRNKCLRSRNLQV